MFILPINIHRIDESSGCSTVSPPLYHPVRHNPHVHMIRCPVCKSDEIYAIVGGYIGQIYRCKSCGYRGSLVVECRDEKGRDRECK